MNSFFLLIILSYNIIINDKQGENNIEKIDEEVRLLYDVMRNEVKKR